MDHASVKKIAIFRALQLGDMLCAIPAIKAVRGIYPTANISLIGLPWAASFVSRYPDLIDRFIAFPGMDGLPEQEADEQALERFILSQQAEQYDLVIQLQGDGRLTNDLIGQFHAQQNAGAFYKDKPSGLFSLYQQAGHEIHRLLSVVSALGEIPISDDLFFPVQARDHKALQECRLNFLPHSYICLHPGARDTTRRWPTVYFALLADMLQYKGFMVVLTGTQDEMPIVEEVRLKMRSKPIIAAGKTSLGGLAALIQKAAFLVSNCTGVAHLAVAVNTPAIILSLEKEYHRWAPLDQLTHRSFKVDQYPDVSEIFHEINVFVDQSTRLREAT